MIIVVRQIWTLCLVVPIFRRSPGLRVITWPKIDQRISLSRKCDGWNSLAHPSFNPKCHFQRKSHRTSPLDTLYPKLRTLSGVILPVAPGKRTPVWKNVETLPMYCNEVESNDLSEMDSIATPKCKAPSPHAAPQTWSSPSQRRRRHYRSHCLSIGVSLKGIRFIGLHLVRSSSCKSDGCLESSWFSSVGFPKSLETSQQAAPTIVTFSIKEWSKRRRCSRVPWKHPSTSFATIGVWSGVEWG